MTQELLVRPLYSAEQIQSRLAELAGRIARDYAGRKLHCIGVLKGSFVFMADLLRLLELDVTVDFLTTSSYGNATRSSGEVQLLLDLSAPIADRHVLIVEDIVDTGLTLNFLLETLGHRHPASLEVCAFLDKPAARQVAVPLRYTGFEVGNEFVVGYGLDAAQRLRHLPFLGVLENPEAL